MLFRLYVSMNLPQNKCRYCVEKLDFGNLIENIMQRSKSSQQLNSKKQQYFSGDWVLLNFCNKAHAKFTDN